ncbi:MAG: alanine dehydrogenase [Bacteroidetes bacterium]|nr:alanine dehydrogenase [Bacteroidota bacterium]
MQLGIIKETKSPPDSRVALTPIQCRMLLDQFQDLSIKIEPSEDRCYTDDEYRDEGLELSEELFTCDVLIGVKEVAIESLIPGKTYMFFSQTNKEQSYNQKLLKAILEQNISLVDYECLTDDKGIRILGFGHWAGIIGAYNGLMANGIRNSSIELGPAYKFRDYDEMKMAITGLDLPAVKIVITGGGRVAKGAEEVLGIMGVDEVDKEDFLTHEFNHPVYVKLDVDLLYEHKDDQHFEIQNFFDQPQDYDCIFMPYTRVADIMVNAIYWDPRAPRFFTREEMKGENFRIKTIADISCDVEGSVPATLRVTTSDNPVYGYDPQTEMETNPYLENAIDIMAVDTLPSELPRDASSFFGNEMIRNVIPELFKKTSEVIRRATIASDGKLTNGFEYLKEYADI